MKRIILTFFTLMLLLTAAESQIAINLSGGLSNYVQENHTPYNHYDTIVHYHSIPSFKLDLLYKLRKANLCFEMGASILSNGTLIKTTFTKEYWRNIYGGINLSVQYIVKNKIGIGVKTTPSVRLHTTVLITGDWEYFHYNIDIEPFLEYRINKRLLINAKYSIGQNDAIKKLLAQREVGLNLKNRSMTIGVMYEFGRKNKKE